MPVLSTIVNNYAGKYSRRSNNFTHERVKTQMMQFSRKSLPFIFLLLVSSSALLAQQPAYYKTNATFRKGLELFDNNQFASAAELFRQVYTDPQIAGSRSEEHTSELQSLMRITYAVFCWKQKKN